MFKFALPLFLILLSGGLFFTYIDPTYQKISELRQEVGQYDGALNKSKELRTARDRLLSKYNIFAANDLNNLRKFLPDNVDNVRLIMEIDNMASKYGVLIRKVGIGAPSSNGRDSLGPNVSDYDSMVLDFTVEAPYGSFVKFLNDMANSLRIVDVTDFSFQSANIDLYKYQLSVKTYWLK